MKPTILLVNIFASLVFAASSQVFEHGNGLIYDGSSSSVELQAFVTDVEGNNYSFYTGDGYFAYPSGASSPDQTIKYFKHDKDGNLIWQFAGGDFSGIYAAEIDDLGNIYVAGAGGLSFINPTNCPGCDNYNYFVAKMNTDGVFDWAVCVPGFTKLTTTTGGKVFFASVYDAIWGQPSCLGLSTLAAYDNQIVYGEIESNGSVAWYDLTPSSVGNDGRVDGVAYNNGKIYMYGYYEGTFDFGGIQYTLSNVCGTFLYRNMFLATFDLNSQGFTEIIDADYLRIKSIKFDQNNNIIFGLEHTVLAGMCGGTVGTFQGVSFPEPDRDAYIIKTDEQFNVIALHDLAGPYIAGQDHQVHFDDMTVSENDLYVSFQNIYPVANFQVSPSAPNTGFDRHIYLMRLDDSLNYKFHTTIPVAGNSIAYGYPSTMLIDSKGDHLTALARTVSPYTSSTFIHNNFIGSYKTNANFVEGIVFRDFNNNNIYDAGDVPYTGGVLNISPTPYLTVCELDGTFSSYLDTGTYEFSLTNIPLYYNAVSPLTSINFTGNNGTAFVEVPISPALNVKDIEVELFPSSLLVIDETTQHQVVVENVGTTVQDVFIEVNPLNLGFPAGSIVTTPTLFNDGGVFRDTIYGMIPGQIVEYQITYLPPVSMLSSIGNSGSTSVTATIAIGDFTPYNNTASYTQTLLAAYDPNIKEVAEPHLLDYFNLDDIQYMHYTIHFQNEGNYHATNVRIEDEIELESNLILSSLKLISSSDPVYATITGQKIRFHFDSIMLPAKSEEELESRGFVHFKLLRSSVLDLGDTVSNSAGIYFDSNPPIWTNDATNIVVDYLGSKVLNISEIAIYPNPTSTKLTIVNIPDLIEEIQLVDLSGNILLSRRVESKGKLELSLPENLRQGIYFLKIGSVTKTLVIQ